MRTNTKYIIQRDNGSSYSMLNITIIQLYINAMSTMYRYIVVMCHRRPYDPPLYHRHPSTMCHHTVVSTPYKSKTGKYASKTYNRCIAYQRAVYNFINKHTYFYIQPIQYTTTRRLNMTIAH